MKTTKKIVAALIAVLMIVMMIPAVSAATSYSVNVTGKAGYEATVYKIASINTTSGAYSDFATGLSKADFAYNDTKKSVDSAALLAKCESLTSLPTGVTLKFTDTALTQTFTTENAGVYYIKVTKVVTGNKKAGGAIISLPEYKSGAWSNPDAVTLKIEDGTVTVDKNIIENGAKKKTTTANIGDTITYELTASVVGSLDAPITEYTIHDNLSTKLSNPAITNVAIDGVTLDSSNYTVSTSNQADITMSINSAYLADAKNNKFYDKSNVVVTLTAVLNETATIGASTEDNKNSDSLTYTNKFGQSTVPGPTVYVYTFDVSTIKVDANDENKVLEGAGFTLYTDAKCTTVANNGKEIKTGSNGIATFTGIKDGTYYLKETTAPAGYSLNATVFEVKISSTGAVTVSNGELKDNKVKVTDAPIVMPATGGMGTMVFSIVGISLIACAGILFVVVRRKKASK